MNFFEGEKGFLKGSKMEGQDNVDMDSLEHEPAVAEHDRWSQKFYESNPLVLQSSFSCYTFCWKMYHLSLSKVSLMVR